MYLIEKLQGQKCIECKHRCYFIYHKQHLCNIRGCENYSKLENKNNKKEKNSLIQ